MSGPRDEFLSEEDLDLKALTMRQLIAYWNQWLRQAQATNDLDRLTYSHGVFRDAPDTRASTPSDRARHQKPAPAKRARHRKTARRRR
jgi:hypothetical protein